MNSDPISDMLTRLRNALSARLDEVRMPHSKIKEAIAKIFKQHGYISDFRVEDSGFKFLILTLDNSSEAVTSISRISKPSRRVYAGRNDIPRVLNGRGIVIVSTSSGLMTGQEASKRGLGGELICQVY
jgi:small subunit ribosomal protein S8